jgi:hypothetical protein
MKQTFYDEIKSEKELFNATFVQLSFLLTS